MEIITNSGAVEVNKRSNYGKWLIGYTESGAWSGHATVEATWHKQKDNKPDGCSWKAWGYICGKHINPLYSALKERKETLKALKEDWDEVKATLTEKGVEIPVKKGMYIDVIEDFI